MKSFRAKNVQYSTYGKEKKPLFYILTLVSILGNFVDIALLYVNPPHPVFYINSIYIVICSTIGFLYFFRKIKLELATGLVLYMLISNFVISQLLTNPLVDNYEAQYLRQNLFMWIIVLVAGFSLNKKHVLYTGLIQLLTLFWGIGIGNTFLLEHFVMLLVANLAYTFFIYYSLNLLERNHANSQNFMESLQKEKLKIQLQEQKIRVADDTKSKLFAIISHDLKNHSNLLLNFSQLLKTRISQNDYEPASQMAEAIFQAADNNNNLLNNLLEWAKTQSGAISFQPQLLDLELLLNDLRLQFDFTLKNKHIYLVYENNIEQAIYADKHMLSSILRNLIANAIKFSPISGIITIRCNQEQDNLKIEVEDNGLGIPESKIEEIEKEQPVQSRRGTSDEKGSGLGLSICQTFMKQHKGSMHIKSIEGKSTTVSIFLPLSSNRNRMA